MRISPAIFAIGLFIPILCNATNLVQNGSFSLNSISATASFSIDGSDLTGWAATPSPNKFLDCVIFLNDTGPLCGGTSTNNPNGWSLSFYVNPGPSPDGGNFVGVDGDAGFATPLTQTLTSALQIGVTYSVSFYQAAGQQSGFTGATTEQWGVCLSTATCTSANATKSLLMNTPSGGGVGWMKQTLTFKATAVTETLTFLALGTPSGQPPFVFLDGVTVQATPEPATILLIGLGGLALLTFRLRAAN